MERDYSYMVGNKFAVGVGPNSTSFKKGLVPWNKDLKGIRLSPKSEFKKGNINQKWVPVGTERIRKDKSGKERRWVKVADPKTWLLKAVQVWLQNGGTIPDGFLLHHLDKNSLNDSLDNLSLVSRSAHINIHRDDLQNGKIK